MHTSKRPKFGSQIAPYLYRLLGKVSPRGALIAILAPLAFRMCSRVGIINSKTPHADCTMAPTGLGCSAAAGKQVYTFLVQW